jgi:hypothetical protein
MVAFVVENVMKTSNLALRADTGEPLAPAPSPRTPAPAESTPAGQRLMRTRRLGLAYRAIAIRDQGLRLFWMR